MNNLLNSDSTKTNSTPTQSTPTSKIHPLVWYLIGGDFLSLTLAVTGLFLPTINTIGAYFMCMGGTITTSTSPESMLGTISCLQNGATEEITYIAMAFTFVFFSLLFAAMSSIYYFTTQKKSL